MPRKGKKKPKHSKEAEQTTSTSGQQPSQQSSQQQQQQHKQQQISQPQATGPSLPPQQPTAFGSQRPQQPAAFGSQRPQQPAALVSQRPQQPGAWGFQRPQQPSPSVPPHPQQPGAWGPQRPQQPGAWGPQRPQQPTALGPQRPQQPSPSAPLHPQQPTALGSQRPQKPGAWGPQQPPKEQHVSQPAPQTQPTTAGVYYQPPAEPVSTSHLPKQQVLGAGDPQKITKKGDGVPRGTAISSSSKSTESSQLDTFSAKSKSQISERDLNIPRRRNRDGGTKGTRINVLTNMFQIVFDPKFASQAMHYDVKMECVDIPTKPVPSSKKTEPSREFKNKPLRRQIFEACRKQYFPNRYPAFDGMSNAFAAKDLPFTNTFIAVIEIYDKERENNRQFQITMTKAGIVDLSWLQNLKPGIPESSINQTSIQVLDVILRHAPASRLISVGRSFFHESSRVQSLGSGLDMHIGGFMSATVGWRPYLNVDVVHKAFVTPNNIIDLMCELSGVYQDNLNERSMDKEKIHKFLSGLKVNYMIPGQPSTKRTFRANGLGPNCIEHTFDVNGKQYTTLQYFNDVKRYKVKQYNLPCIWVGKRDGQTYLPAELCSIVPGQASNKKLDESQTSIMVKYAATPTEIRQSKIKKAFNDIDMNNSDVVKNEFIFNVKSNLQQVGARILNPPYLSYNDRQPVKVNKGVWRAKKFNTPVTLGKDEWIIVNISGPRVRQHIDEFTRALQEQAKNFGMTIGQPSSSQESRPNPYEIEKIFNNCKKLQLIIVILPNRTDPIYGKVKQISELKVGVLTQCVKAKNIEARNISTIQNILLKINSKLNGINHTFSSNTTPACLCNTKYMLIGADVSHPSPDAKNIPSVAAVAASHDETTFKYNVTIRLQQAKQEEISDLKEIMLKHIAFYVREMNTVPQRIIFYRDGVSEGQIGSVLQHEINSIKQAFVEYARIKPGFNPQLTFIIVQKRHHVRLFPINSKNPLESDDRNGNVKAGTIVDTEITHPNHIDFYLVSHASIQGTARPTKYRCIRNESNFDEDQLEELTYYLCHMYARCTRSVSYPAPTYYAHLAAYRGRMWIQGDSYTEKDFTDKNKCKLEPKLKMPMSFI